MADKDKDRVVMERGIGDDWHSADYLTSSLPAPSLYRRLRSRLPDWADYEWARWLGRGVIVLILTGLSLLALIGSFKGFSADGMSMEPTVHDGDHLIVNRLSYAHIDLGFLDWLPLINIDARWDNPSRGDVIIFHSPIEDKELIKRVIGMPGDTVNIQDGGVYINDERLAEPYAVGETECTDVCEWTVPGDSFFVLGDNRQNSLDSRGGWFVPVDNIAGKELLSY